MNTDMLLHSASGYINMNDKPPFDAEFLSLGFNDLTVFRSHDLGTVCYVSSSW